MAPLSHLKTSANYSSNRRLDNKLNIFEGITRNYFFIGIQFIIVAGQIMIVFVGGRAFSVHRLNGPQWGYCLVLGALSLPWAVVLRCIPDELVRKAIPNWWTERAMPQVKVSDEEQHYEWNPALTEIREELTFLRKFRGGRLKMIQYKLQHPRETLLPRSRSNSRSVSREPTPPVTPIGDHSGSDFGSPVRTPESRSRARTRSRSNSAFGPAAAMAGIVAGSIAGWSPIERGHSEADSIRFVRSASHSGLEGEDGIEIHPETDPNDPVIAENPKPSDLPPSQNPALAPAYGSSLAPPGSTRSRRSNSALSTNSRTPSNLSHSQQPPESPK